MAAVPAALAKPLSRRSLLASGVGLVAAPFLAARPLRPGGGRLAMFVNLAGGNDALNTLVPARLSAYRSVRGPIAIPAHVGLGLDSGPYANRDYVLHPAMPTVARLYHEGQVAFVRLVGYPGANGSHTSGEETWSRGGVTPLWPDSGWIARYKEIYAREAIAVVALGLQGRLDFWGDTPATFLLPPPSSRGSSRTILHGDSRYPANDRLRDRIAQELAATPRTTPLLDRAAEALRLAYAQDRQLRAPRVHYEIGATYPDSDLGAVFGWSASILRDEQPVHMFYTRTQATSFDTHSEQGGVQGRHADALADVDATLAAFIEDLQALGRWDQAVIVLFSEFGRRNGTSFNGTDHGDGGLMIVLGGAIRGGMYGPDLRDEHLRATNLPAELDFRNVYAELLERHFEADPARVLLEDYRHEPLGLFA